MTKQFYFGFILAGVIISSTLFIAEKATPKPKPITIYTSVDILYVDYENRTVEFESLDEPVRFSTQEGLVIYLENITSDHANYANTLIDLQNPH